MGCRIFVGREHGLPEEFPDSAHFFCSTTLWAFGPIFEDTKGYTAVELALLFRDWLPSDPRSYGDSVLEGHYEKFLDQLRDKS